MCLGRGSQMEIRFLSGSRGRVMSLVPESEEERNDLAVADGARAIMKEDLSGKGYLLLVKDGDAPSVDRSPGTSGGAKRSEP